MLVREEADFNPYPKPQLVPTSSRQMGTSFEGMNTKRCNFGGEKNVDKAKKKNRVVG